MTSTGPKPRAAGQSPRHSHGAAPAMHEPASELTCSPRRPAEPSLGKPAQRWVQLLAALAMLAACGGPSVDVPVAPADGGDQEVEADGGADDDAQDRDEDDDERLVPCAEATTCDAQQPYCSPIGFCVECLRDSQCPSGEHCDEDEGECEKDRD